MPFSIGFIFRTSLPLRNNPCYNEKNFFADVTGWSSATTLPTTGFPNSKRLLHYFFICYAADYFLNQTMEKNIHSDILMELQKNI